VIRGFASFRGAPAPQTRSNCVPVGVGPNELALHLRRPLLVLLVIHRLDGDDGRHAVAAVPRLTDRPRPVKIQFDGRGAVRHQLELPVQFDLARWDLHGITGDACPARCRQCGQARCLAGGAPAKIDRGARDDEAQLGVAACLERCHAEDVLGPFQLLQIARPSGGGWSAGKRHRNPLVGGVLCSVRLDFGKGHMYGARVVERRVRDHDPQVPRPRWATRRAARNDGNSESDGQGSRQPHDGVLPASRCARAGPRMRGALTAPEQMP